MRLVSLACLRVTPSWLLAACLCMQEGPRSATCGLYGCSCGCPAGVAALASAHARRVERRLDYRVGVLVLLHADGGRPYRRLVHRNAALPEGGRSENVH